MLTIIYAYGYRRSILFVFCVHIQSYMFSREEKADCHCGSRMIYVVFNVLFTEVLLMLNAVVMYSRFSEGIRKVHTIQF